MKRAARFLTGRKTAPDPDRSGSPSSVRSETTCDYSKASKDLDNGLKGLDRVLDDDMVGAKKILDQGDGPFSKLGRAVMVFLEAALGFESDCVRQAETKLTEAEKACIHERHAVLRANVQFSKLYPPGTEYHLAYAEAHIMGALLLFTSESLVDSMKAAYKLRRCYHILSEIYDIVHQVPTADRVMTHRVTHMTIDEAIKEESMENTPNSSRLSLRDQDDDALDDDESDAPVVMKPLFRPLSGKDIGNEFDEYIESGVNVCFGLLQLVLSLMPPTLGKVLSVIGFKGDRREGLDMLWRSSSIMNIHGALALFCLVQYFCGPAQQADIESKKRTAALSVCEKSLFRLKTLYEHSTLWALHEARLYSVQRESKRALAVLKKPYNIQMKAIQGMLYYDRGMAYLDTHEYEKTAESFIELMKVNSWSLALYQYIIGSCYVELYRIELRKNEAVETEKALEYKSKALDHLQKAPTVLAARTFMARRMPFDLFVERKIKKWNARLAAVLSAVGDQVGVPEIDLVDAIGVSPIHEIIYFNNGFKKMEPDYLVLSLSSVCRAFEPLYDGEVQPEDELAAEYLLRARILRGLERYDECDEMLMKDPLNLNKSQVKNLPPLHEEWPFPSAVYEKAVLEWETNNEDDKDNKPAMKRVKELLLKSASWGDYELSSRVGIRIQSGLETLKDEYQL